MKKILNSIGIILCFFSCAPNATQLKQTVENDPSIIFAAIEKAPAQFMEAVMKAQQEFQRISGEKSQQEEMRQREAEFKTPLKPEIEPHRVVFGNKSAPITIVEYSDFQCPYCSKGFQTIQLIKKEYGDKVKIIFKHLPLEMHPQAMPAARYFEAIAEQSPDQAEKFHDIIFKNQSELTEKGEVYLKKVVQKMDLDMKKLDIALKSKKINQQISKDMDEAKKFNLSGTPGFIINGVSLRGAYPFSAFKEIIDRKLIDM